MNKKNFVLLSAYLTMALFGASCQQLKYVSDSAFMNSAQANSAEYLARINDSVCKDVDGIIGLCAKRIKSDSPVKFSLDKRPYNYRLNVTCSSDIGFNLSVDVLSEKEFSFLIPAENISRVLSFTCIGEVFPADRSQQASAFWHSRFLVIDKNYRPREQIYTDERGANVGQHALHITLNDDKSYRKKTVIKSKRIKRIYSESQQMRFNYAGY